MTAILVQARTSPTEVAPRIVWTPSDFQAATAANWPRLACGLTVA